MNEVTSDIESKKIEICHPRWMDGDEEVFYESEAVAELIADEVVTLFNSGDEPVLYVFENDVFQWASSGFSRLPMSQIRNLYMLWQWHRVYGPIVWACMMDNMRPQLAIRIDMAREGCWPRCFDYLRPNNDEE